jgi:hypothetical protein
MYQPGFAVYIALGRTKETLRHVHHQGFLQLQSRELLAQRIAH